MELVFPWALYLGIPCLVVVCLLSFKKKEIYNEGKRVANTSFVEETEEYKKVYMRYRILSSVCRGALIVSAVIGLVLISRPVKVDTITPEIRNRDIFLCMDISTSVDELNLDICDELKNVVKELDGERFGISIFNGQSVLMVPLTTDYQYVLDTLDTLKRAFEISIKSEETNFDIWFEEGNEDLYYYKYEGTFAEEGSSFIGDGLASCLYSFPDLETNKERSRMIIFTTDNELNGTPYVTIEEATALCKKNKVKVFSIVPENVTDESIFKGAIESTGGKYYKNTDKKAYKQLTEDIKKTEASVMEKTEVRKTDQPETCFVLLLVCLGSYFLISRKVML